MIAKQNCTRCASPGALAVGSPQRVLVHTHAHMHARRRPRAPAHTHHSTPVRVVWVHLEHHQHIVLETQIAVPTVTTRAVMRCRTQTRRLLCARATSESNEGATRGRAPNSYSCRPASTPRGGALAVAWWCNRASRQRRRARGPRSARAARATTHQRANSQRDRPLTAAPSESISGPCRGRCVPPPGWPSRCGTVPRWPLGFQVRTRLRTWGRRHATRVKHPRRAAIVFPPWSGVGSFGERAPLAVATNGAAGTPKRVALLAHCDHKLERPRADNPALVWAHVRTAFVWAFARLRSCSHVRACRPPAPRPCALLRTKTAKGPADCRQTGWRTASSSARPG